MKSFQQRRAIVAPKVEPREPKVKEESSSTQHVLVTNTHNPKAILEAVVAEMEIPSGSALVEVRTQCDAATKTD